MYCIVDIETTGNGIKGNKITEISIFRFDGYEIVEEFTSLVNPEMQIPYFITGLTGIDDNLVRDAPLLSDIADRILEITKDAIFVAHSVNFDYNVIKNEFKTIGLEFNRKKLCTVRLSRKLIPGYHSYSLGKLCSSLGIPITDRHRARGDAFATVTLFKKLLRTPDADQVFKAFLNARSQEATLPPSLPKITYEKLPAKPGIYFFKDNKGKIIYVGKAINIKKRVLGHFYDKKNKEVRLCRDTADIDFELSGSELLALLMESNAIKKYYPEYNRAQKRNVQQYAIFNYEDRNNIQHLAFNKLKLVPNALISFTNTTECRLYLEDLCKTFELCAKYCHLQEGATSCSHYRIPTCGGICLGTESTANYNKKVAGAITHMQMRKAHYMIKEKGRTVDEDAFIVVQDDVYQGYGFVEKSIEISSYSDLKPFLQRTKSTIEAQSILSTYISKNSDNLLMEAVVE